MYGRVNTHGLVVGIFVGNLIIHIKQVTIVRSYRIFTQALDRIGKVEVYGYAGSTHPAAFIHPFFCIP